MEYRKRCGKCVNYILAFCVVAANVFLLGSCFDFYYDLNDDTMMHDIMAGIYTGTPDGHNMQTLYPLGAVLALCYRLCGQVPWYGLFLCLCQFGCLYLVGVRLCALADGIGKPGGWRKAILLLAMPLYLWGVCLPHFINIQYTVTCTMLSATAIFLFLTSQEKAGTWHFFADNLPSVFLVIVAYQLRSEMLLLTFPFLCLAGLCRIVEEKKVFAKENLYQYGAVLGAILVGMLVCSAIDYIAYGSREWRDFRSFFDARTTVYDFYQELITEDAYGNSLAELGIGPAQQALLRNYNFGLDDGMDSALLGKAADYAVGAIGGSKDWGGILRKQVGRYLYRTFRGGDAPYSTVVLWAYAAVLVAGFFVGRSCGARNQTVQIPTLWQKMCGIARRYAFLWQIMLLAVMRTAIWMFILMREREPERITHSLYMVEFALLAAMCVRMQLCYRQNSQACKVNIAKPDDRVSLPFPSEAIRKGVIYVMAGLFCLITINGMINGIVSVQADQEWREQVNRSWFEIDAYCRERKENFYFEDVYSTVLFSHKLFGQRDNTYANYDILGGWMCKSPLYYEKLGRYNIVSVSKELPLREDLYVIMSDEELEDRGLSWLTDYYKAQGIMVVARQVDRIDEGYAVYQITIE